MDSQHPPFLRLRLESPQSQASKETGHQSFMTKLPVFPKTALPSQPYTTFCMVVSNDISSL